MQRELTSQDAVHAENISKVWVSDDRMPSINWDSFQHERAAVDTGQYFTVPHFKVMKDIFDIINPDSRHTVLEVGAGSAYYKHLFEVVGVQAQYTGMDCSESAKSFAEAQFPGVSYLIGDAINIPLADASFDTVISGWILIHIYDWEKSIQEATRVSKRWVVLHRVTTHWGEGVMRREAKIYGADCLMNFFTIAEIMGAIRSAGLQLRALLPVSGSGQFVNYSFLCEKTL